ncbi:MAG: hypothetical protein GEU89_15420 [Kiloniellaceae bacterium]|nr:hypothetical protein [Kiloniellaceae bacterium]
MARSDRYWLHGLAQTPGLYVLVSVAIADTFGLFFFVMLGTLALSVPLFYRMFPGSHFTTIALANFIFGLSEVLRYARERGWREQRRCGHH